MEEDTDNPIKTRTIAQSTDTFHPQESADNLLSFEFLPPLPRPLSEAKYEDIPAIKAKIPWDVFGWTYFLCFLMKDICL